MTSIKINDKGAREQYTVLPAQTNFSYPFEIFEDEDLTVWLTPLGQTPDPVLDLLVLTTDYTVTNAGVEGGGDVVLNVPATAGDIVTLIRDIPIDRLFDYTVGGDFTGDSINQQLDVLTMTQQQNESVDQTRQLTYPSLLDLETGDVTLPKLDTNQIWTMSAADGLIAADITESTGWSTLRSELANDLTGTDGSKIVGHYSSKSGSTTVHDELETLIVSAAYYSVTAGTPNTFTATVSSVLTYFDGMTLRLKMHASNTGAATINVNGLGAKNITRSDGNTFAANDLLINLVYTFVYQGTEFVLSNIQPASETSEGLISLATTAEVKTATNALKAVTPLKMIQHPGVAKAWVTFDAAGAIQDSYNCTSVTLVGGRYNIVWSVTFANAFWCESISHDGTISGSTNGIDGMFSSNKTTTGNTIEFVNNLGGIGAPTLGYVVVFGELA